MGQRKADEGENTPSITSSTKTLLGVFACSRTGSAAVAFFCANNHNYFQSKLKGMGRSAVCAATQVQVCGESVELPQLHLLAAWLQYIGMVVDVPVVWGMRGSSSTR